MRFIIDAQLPPALAGWLREKGHQAQHVSEIDLLTADDSMILARCIAEQAVLITKDRDFIRPSNKQAILQLIWVRTGNVSTRVLLDRLETVWPQILAHLADNASLVEFR